MYPKSSQRNEWTFANEKVLFEMRRERTQKYFEAHGKNIPREEFSTYFLSDLEENAFIRQYEIYLMDFCRRFEPPMPRFVHGTACHYFKRFYLHNSAMDYHPKEMLATCVYLACKVEEFNVSIGQFVANIKGDRQKAMDIILSNELLLMQQLNYYLTIHNPYRPIEGFLIDIKTRSKLKNPERLRQYLEEFIDQSFLTDVCLLYAPSQIAMAAILHATGEVGENIDHYVTETLLEGNKDRLKLLVGTIRKIRLIVKNQKPPTKDQIRICEKKLEKCRNPENNPDSQSYRDRMNKLFDDDDPDLMGPGTLNGVAELSKEMDTSL